MQIVSFVSISSCLPPRLYRCFIRFIRYISARLPHFEIYLPHCDMINFTTAPHREYQTYYCSTCRPLSALPGELEFL